MRGSIADMLMWIVLLFIVGFAFLVTGMVRDAIATPMIAMFENDTSQMGDSTTNETVRHAFAQADRAIMNFNAGFVMIFGALVFGTILLAHELQIPGFYLPILIFVLAIILIVATIFSNAFQDMTATGDLGTEAEQWGIMTAVMQHLPTLLLIAGALIIIVMVGTRGAMPGGLK